MGLVQLAILIGSIYIAKVSAECCTPPWRFALGYYKSDTGCGDGKYGERCCGRGACNIFCCNCDDGCRHSTDDTFYSRFQPGDVIACKMNDVANHIMLAIDNDYFAESHGGSKDDHDAAIKIRNWSDAVRGYDNCRIITEEMDRKMKDKFGHPDGSPFADVNTIANRARSWQNRNVYYDMHLCNCEHWVTYWRYGKAYSLQATMGVFSRNDIGKCTFGDFHSSQ